MSERVTESIIVKGTAESVYSIWASYENFPHFMKYVKSVKPTIGNQSRWEIEGPLGKDLTYIAEQTLSEPGKRIGWKTIEGAVNLNGTVTFTDLENQQTQITVILMYDAPGGKLGELVGEIFANPAKRLTEDLQNFKQYIEGMPNRTAAR